MCSRRLVLLAIAAAPSVLDAQTKSWTTDRTLAYDFDLRQSNADADKLGLDFSVAYTLQRTRANPQGNHFGLSVSAEGFQDFATDVRELDQMTGEVSLQGRYYATSITPLRADVQAHYLKLLDKPLASLTPAERDELTELARRVTANRRFLVYDVHYRFETTQDVDTSQHALGASVGGELPHLHRILDAIPAGVFTRRANFRPQPVRARLALDYVVGEQALTPTTDVADNRYPRLSLETAWSTLVVGDLLLRATWIAQYILDPPRPLEARDREFNSIVQAWIVYPVSKDVGLVVKYVDGRMPPTYDSSSVGKIGFSISLQ